MQDLQLVHMQVQSVIKVQVNCQFLYLLNINIILQFQRDPLFQSQSTEGVFLSTLIFRKEILKELQWMEIFQKNAIELAEAMNNVW